MKGKEKGDDGKGPSVNNNGPENNKTVRYRVTDSDYSPPENHQPLIGDDYICPYETRLEQLDSQGVIDVLEWDYNSGTDDSVTLNGPSEPVVRDDGTIEICYVDEQLPGGETFINSIELGTWECQQCNQTFHRSLTDGKLEEPETCEHCDRGGPFKSPNGLDESDIQTAIRAGRIWHTPSGVSDEEYSQLWDDIETYLKDHWDASEPEIYAGLTAYALSTWFRENLTFVPHLMLMGKTTGGKTRLLNTLARVSYRALVTASATPASMFRLIDAYNVSYYISEYHGLGNETRRELDNVVRAGQKRGEVVTRAEQATTGYEPKVFDPFAHVAVATQYTPDDDIINRCIQVRSSPANRDMPATFDEDRGCNIRNRLLYARYRLLENDEWEQAEQQAYAYLAEHGIEGRTREKLLSLVTVAFLWDRIEELEPFVEEVTQQDREASADSEDALVVEAIRECAFDEVGSITTLDDTDPFASVEIPLGDVAERYEQMTGTEKTAAWVGQVRSRLGFEKERRRDGTVIFDPDLRTKLRELCDEHNLDWEPLESHSLVKELPDDEKGPGASGCEICGHDRKLTHKHIEQNCRICSECANTEGEV